MLATFLLAPGGCVPGGLLREVGGGPEKLWSTQAGYGTHSPEPPTQDSEPQTQQTLCLLLLCALLALTLCTTQGSESCMQCKVNPVALGCL